MQLLPEVHVVASGDGGFGLTHPFDCNVYLLDGGSESALVDAGIGAAAEAILANAAAALGERAPLRSLLLTHVHPDHAGGAAFLKERVPGLRVLASREVAGWVRKGDEEAMSVETGKRAELYPSDFRFRPCRVDGELADGGRVSVGDLVVEAIETPGHADGHVSYLVEGPSGRLLFAGDLVFFGGLISLLNTWDCRLQAYAASMGKLRGAAIDALLPGHHAVSLSNGQRHVDAANRLFEHGFVPKSVV